MFEKPEGATKNGQSWDIGNIVYTRHRRKTIEKHNTGNKTYEQHKLHQKPSMNPGTRKH